MPTTPPAAVAMIVPAKVKPTEFARVAFVSTKYVNAGLPPPSPTWPGSWIVTQYCCVVTGAVMATVLETGSELVACYRPFESGHYFMSARKDSSVVSRITSPPSARERTWWRRGRG